LPKQKEVVCRDDTLLTQNTLKIYNIPQKVGLLRLNPEGISATLLFKGAFTMAKHTLSPPAGFDQLTVPEQIEYVQGLWEQIATSPEAVTTPDWHLDIIRRRLQDFEQHPEIGKSWDEVRTEIEQQLQARPSK